ncbi:autotransporter outer membrane beta-barrel domain-containing protein [Helicobacter pametensis]|uniref:autotransporter outer membrane beta-barrel domain-containing protein n=1 Tax=Helicobacter pametensis TaxID=95149 RepID=UPI00048181B7|nr:autotransporter outer membrane beta-barrel domain-containing protein [Helicobacter pametensis]
MVFKSGTATIDGKIEASVGGKNEIYLGDSTIAYLLKDITASGGSGQNIIKSTGELIIQNTSTPQTISATYGQNTITAQTITLGSSGQKINLTVNGKNATSEAKNSITSTGRMTAHFGEVKAHENGTGNGKRTNEIIGGSGSEIYIEKLSATDSANNSNHVTVSKDGSLTIKTITSSNGGQNNITIGENSRATIIDSIPNGSSSDGSNHFTLKGDGAYLTFQGGNTKISSLTSSGKTLIDLAGIEDGRPKENITAANAGANNNIRKTLEIGTSNGRSGSGNSNGFKGEAAFEVYVGGGKNDTVTFKSASKQDGNSNSVATIVASGDIHTILNGDGQTHKLATVENGAKVNMEVKGGERLIGGVIVETVLTPKNGGNNGEYYLGKGIDKGTPVQYQEVARSALTTGYDLYLANFNSINKRMGELRDNPYSQGVWARVFGGSTSSDFGSGSTTNYVTLQAGYDYSLSFNNAKNYMGIALAYAKSWTKGNALSMNGLIGASETISLSNVDSDMVEVGIYNSYVADNGWYNDTILKFDYIMSKFALSNRSDFYTDTDNFAIVLSDEFGYRYKFGDDESWYIDPQAEVALGYFNQTDFNRAMQDASGLSSTTLNAKQENILTLRGRAGMSLGKRFTTDQGFVSLYVGTFYEYDYIYGGNASLVGREGGKSISLNGLESNGRIIVNTGSNIALTESTRLYIDVEKSFGDKQRTHMQFNFGARYSF